VDKMDAIEIMRWINFSLAFIAICGWVYFYRRFKEPASIASLTWLINVFAYYAFRLFSLGFTSTIKNTYFLNMWSGILHTHAILLLGIGIFIAIPRLLNNKTYMERLEKKLKEKKEEDKDETRYI
jgi:hypothetical protein